MHINKLSIALSLLQTSLVATRSLSGLSSVSVAAFPALRGQPLTNTSRDQHTRHVVLDVAANSFTPPTLQAGLNDTVMIYFMNPDTVTSANVSIIQSTYDRPCQPLSGGVGQIPISSGPIAVNKTVNSKTPTVATLKFVIPITTTDPVWLYASSNTASTCACSEGAVFVINPLNENYGQSLEGYKDAAAKLSTNISDISSIQNVNGGSWESCANDKFVWHLLDQVFAGNETSTGSFSGNATSGAWRYTNSSTAALSPSLASEVAAAAVAAKTAYNFGNLTSSISQHAQNFALEGSRSRMVGATWMAAGIAFIAFL